MSPRVRVATHTNTWTRLSALSFQSQRFLELAGIARERAEMVSRAVEQRWIEAIGVYGVDHTNRRVVEQEFAIDWDDHLRLNATKPTIDVSQPGWENDLAVEVSAACDRFRSTIEMFDLKVSFWIVLVPEIRGNQELRRQRCRELGLSVSGSVPEWRGRYTEMSVGLTGLSEATIKMRVYDESP